MTVRMMLRILVLVALPLSVQADGRDASQPSPQPLDDVLLAQTAEVEESPEAGTTPPQPATTEAEPTAEAGSDTAEVSPDTADHTPVSADQNPDAAANPLEVTVQSVTPPAQKQQAGADDDAPWQDLVVGEQLGEQTIIRTGLGARVVLEFSDRGEVVVKGATKMGIGEFRKTGSHVDTRVGMKYGSMRATVDSSSGTNDFRVATPVATLAVEGTGGSFAYNFGWGLWIRSFENDWMVRVPFMPPEQVPQGGWSNDQQQTSDVIFRELLDTQQGGPYSLTGGEKKYLRNHGSGLGLFDFLSGSSRLHPPGAGISPVHTSSGSSGSSGGGGNDFNPEE